MGEPKDLNNPDVYAEALVRAVVNPQREVLAAWLAGLTDSLEKEVTEYPFQPWYLYFADEILDMMPHPELGFQARPKRMLSTPKIGRNDPCPCRSGKKYKKCHLVLDGGEEVMGWKIGSPTPFIRVMSIAHLVHQLPLATLDKVPIAKAPPVALTEMATVYQEHGRLGDALQLVKTVLDGDREDPFLLYDYWIARYAEWLVLAGKSIDGERFLLNEYDNPRGVASWQVAQKLAAFYLDLGDFPNAEVWLDSAMEGDEENPFNHYLKGLLAHYDGMWEAAMASYERARQFSDRFRDEEKIYMGSLIDDALTRAENHQPIENEYEEGEESEEAPEEESEAKEVQRGDGL